MGVNQSHSDELFLYVLKLDSVGFEETSSGRDIKEEVFLFIPILLSKKIMNIFIIAKCIPDTTTI